MNQKGNKNQKKEKLDASQALKDISNLKNLPASPFKPEPGSITIDDILSKVEDNSIAYPDIQRNAVWKVKDQAELIESLIRGIPIPPIYINRCRDKGGKKLWEVLDGRQRITALIDFFHRNMFVINNHLPEGYENLVNYRYKDIEKNNPLFAGKFTSLSLPIIWMDNAPDELKQEFFQKLNKGGKALTVGELAHSSLDPAKDYMVKLMATPFYEEYVQKTNRYAEYVPASKVLHFMYRSMQKDHSFTYDPGLNGWKNRIVTNTVDIQTDLDNIHDVDHKEEVHAALEAEMDRLCRLIDSVLGDIEINSPNNKLLTNMLIELLILDEGNEINTMTTEELTNSFNGLATIWNEGHTPERRQKRKTDLANITDEESLYFNECDKLESSSKNAIADVLENLRNDVYSNYV